ncbi:MAG: His-Xaa-Ser system radical SAM maturase HxsB [bacterium]|nr:His-Xaa-Ser system radical SAM maturase HxsB [bacterium]
MFKTENLEKLNFFRYKKMSDGNFLLTNDGGNYIFLDESCFQLLQNSPEELPTPVQNKLFESYFINDEIRNEGLIKQYRKKNSFLSEGPSLHIIVVTLRCDHSCAYCQTSRKNVDCSDFDMDIKTAERTVDFILKTTAKNINIEFQGGEPLANFATVKHIVEYINKKETGKNIRLSIVTNMTYMDEEKFRFFMDNKVSICTSLDGPEEIHNKYRIVHKGNSFQNTVDWIERIRKENEQIYAETGEQFYRANALLTVTKDTLREYKSIVDLYVGMGLTQLFLRPMNPFGFGEKMHAVREYTAAEFIEFYTNALDYIIEINKSGTEFYESTAKIILTKVINKIDSNYLDQRSPCGAGIGQLAYNYNGDIFTCDEGRMVYEMGDDIFLLGNVKNASYSDIMRSDTVLNLCVASCLEGLPGCNDCVYNPYCGVCPVYNYVLHGSLFAQMPVNDRCSILMGIHDYLFSKLDEHYEIFEKWVNTSL